MRLFIWFKCVSFGFSPAFVLHTWGQTKPPDLRYHVHLVPLRGCDERPNLSNAWKD